MHQITSDLPCLITPGQNQVATTSLENDITFPAAGENDANQPISSNKTREQTLNPADPELQPYRKGKTCFDPHLKDLALHFWTPPRDLCKPYISSLWITRVQEQQYLYRRSLTPLNLPSLNK